VQFGHDEAIAIYWRMVKETESREWTYQERWFCVERRWHSSRGRTCNIVHRTWSETHNSADDHQTDILHNQSTNQLANRCLTA